jgi:MFS superfamily sulfate permease-like transporter
MAGGHITPYWGVRKVFAVITTSRVIRRRGWCRGWYCSAGMLPVFFANAELFQERVLKAVASSPTPVKRIVIAAEPVTSVDVTSVDAITELCATLRAAQIELQFAEMKDPVKDKLKRFEVLDLLGPNGFHPTLGAAVEDYLEQYAVKWKP